MHIHTTQYGPKYHTLRYTRQPHKSQALGTNLRAADVFSMSEEWLNQHVLKDGVLPDKLFKLNQI